MYTGECPNCKTVARLGLIPLDPDGLMVIDRIKVKCPCGTDFEVVHQQSETGETKVKLTYEEV